LSGRAVVPDAGPCPCVLAIRNSDFTSVVGRDSHSPGSSCVSTRGRYAQED
jgi:hypothetical protein